MKKRALCLVLALVLCVSVLPLGAAAADGGSWKKSGTGWWYRNSDGSYPADEWQKIGGAWYHFDADGYMQTGWIKDGGRWYYLRDSGAMATGWVKYGGEWYYLKSSGAMATGWVKDNGTWYYLRSSGIMAVGWVYYGGDWYYLKNSGAMATGWVYYDGDWYYMKSSGAMATGWVKDKGSWYFMTSSGVMLMGWLLDGSDWYHMDAVSGAMDTGWKKLGGEWYYFYPSGVQAVNTFVDGYYLDEDGRIMEEQSTDELVYTGYYAELYDASDVLHVWEIPQLAVNYGSAQDINNDIALAVYAGDVAEDFQIIYGEGEGYGEIITSGVTYDWALNGDILSLWITKDLAMYEWTDIYVYNFDLSTGKWLSTQDIQAYYGLSDDTYYAALRNSLSAYYDNMYSDAWDYISGSPSDLSFYYQQRDKTLSLENLKSCMAFLDDAGEIIVSAKIYGIAGAEYYWHYVPMVF